MDMWQATLKYAAMPEIERLEIFCNLLVPPSQKRRSVLNVKRFFQRKDCGHGIRKRSTRNGRGGRECHMYSRSGLSSVGIVELRRALSKATYEDRCTNKGPRGDL